MDLIESSWFIISSVIIVIVLVVDPKSSITGSDTNSILGFSNSGGQFIYKLSAVLILLFFILTTALSLNN